jgi:hypothetical protein
VRIDMFDFKGSPDWRRFALVAGRYAAEAAFAERPADSVRTAWSAK